jgi:hypothetical protein
VPDPPDQATGVVGDGHRVGAVVQSPQHLRQLRIRPENRRETHLTLTKTGRQTVHTVTSRRRKELRTVLARIPAEQRAGLADAMATFAAAAEPGTNGP